MQQLTRPIRIQKKRTKNWRMPENTEYVGRPTPWGNPFVVVKKIRDDIGFDPFYLVLTPEEAVARFSQFIAKGQFNRRVKEELKGKNLACWCPLDQSCHADVLLEIANS